jgi:hypothetical protein
MSEEPLIACHGIGVMHQSCTIRSQCQRHQAIRKMAWQPRPLVKWHYCQQDHEHFIRVEE